MSLTQMSFSSLTAFDKVRLVSPSSHIVAHFILKNYSNLARISFSLLFLMLFEQKPFCLLSQLVRPKSSFYSIATDVTVANAVGKRK
jgi:hypothetical protein